MKYLRGKGVLLSKLGFGIILCSSLTACSLWGTGTAEKPVSGAASWGHPVIRTGDEQEKKNIVSIIWDEGQNGFVRIVRAEPGAPPNDHPVELPDRQIAAVLAELRLEGNEKPVLTEPEIKELAKPLSTALAQAGPGEDITFASTGRRWGQLSFFVPEVLNTGRVFYKDGQLNVIFGIIQGEFEGELRAVGVLRPYTPGSRRQRLEKDKSVIPSEYLLGATIERADWVQVAALSESGTPVVRATPEPSVGLYTEPKTGIGAPAAASAPSSTSSGSGRGQPSVAPSVASRGAQSSKGSTYAGSAQHYQDIEDRLKGLQRLREQNLITEQEYREKRRMLLDQL